MSRKNISKAIVLGLSLIAPLVCAGQSAPRSVDARRKALTGLLAEQWEYNLSTNPISATALGDKCYNDQLGDFSEEAVEKDLQEAGEPGVHPKTCYSMDHWQCSPFARLFPLFASHSRSIPVQTASRRTSAARQDAAIRNACSG